MKKMKFYFADRFQVEHFNIVLYQDIQFKKTRKIR